MDNDCLLRNDFWKTVRSFAIAEELLVWEVDLSIGKPFSLSPGNILGYGAAFFLCQARHDGEQQFALAVKGVNVLLFKVDFYAFFFQLADSNQAVDRISGEAANRLCDDEVDFIGHGIGDHFIKADTVFGVRAGNALVGVNLNKLPFGIAFDVLRVVIHLRLVAGELLIAVCGNSCVSCDPPFLHNHPGKVRQRIDGRRNDCDRPCCCSVHSFFLLACNARCRAFSFISGVQLSALERSFHRLTISEPSSMQYTTTLFFSALIAVILLLTISMSMLPSPSTSQVRTSSVSSGIRLAAHSDLPLVWNVVQFQ